MKRSKIAACLITALIAAAALAGCAADNSEPVSVQSVAMLAGIGSSGLTDRFGGVVSARSEVKVKADQQKTISEILVEEGDDVTEGQTLFTYDVELAKLDLEKADLELQQMRNTLASRQNEKAELEKQKAKAAASEQLSYTLAIAECDADIREQQYKIAAKEKEVSRLSESVEIQDVTSPVDGRVKTINSNAGGNPDYGYMGGETDDSVMTIIESGTYRVMGYVNENNVAQMTEGLEVIIRSRVSDQTWSGYVSEIDWTNPQSSSSGGYEYYGPVEAGGEMNTTSKYPFYVELNESEGLLLGQHVYIEPDLGEEEAGEDEIILPGYYLVDPDGEAYVWAENKSSGKLEKRKITAAAVDPESGMYLIESGLSADDYIAFPEEDLQEGRPCQEFDEMIPQEIMPGPGEGEEFNYDDMGPEDMMPEEDMLPAEGMQEDMMPDMEAPEEENFEEDMPEQDAPVDEETPQGGEG